MTSPGTTNSIGPGVTSMTGFGSGELTASGRQVSVEIRTVNNRFIDIGLRLPRELNALEGDIRDRIRSRIARGRVSIMISLKKDGLDESPLKLDFQAAQVCFARLQELNQFLGSTAPVSLGQLLHFSDYFTQDLSSSLEKDVKEEVFEALDAALTNLAAMRRTEGVSLAQDLLMRLGKIENFTSQIESLAGEQPQIQMAKLRERLEMLVAAGPLDPGRLETELSLMADRLDVTEECIRMSSHLQLFREAVAGSEPPGKRLGFVLQEMNREANTIGSKSALAAISHLAIGIKEEIERMREQIQNLE
jgi:uncharacterized protein (TIGR00255 family)